MATYTDIQNYIKKKENRTVKTCWIAHAKELHGLPRRNAANRIDSKNRVYKCPQYALVWITEAFRHFKMIK